MVYTTVSERLWYGPFGSVPEAQAHMIRNFPGVRYSIIFDDDSISDAGIL
jgi:hypothetical protein